MVSTSLKLLLCCLVVIVVIVWCRLCLLLLTKFKGFSLLQNSDIMYNRCCVAIFVSCCRCCRVAIVVVLSLLFMLRFLPCHLLTKLYIGFQLASGTIKNTDIMYNKVTYVTGTTGGLKADTLSVITLDNVRIQYNSAPQAGGGVYVQNQGTLRVSNSEISNNFAGIGGLCCCFVVTVVLLFVFVVWIVVLLLFVVVVL